MSSVHPGLARALPRLEASAGGVPDGARLKAEAIRLFQLTGLSRRQVHRMYEGGTRGWTTIQRYLDPGYPKSYPPLRFVQWLSLRVEVAGLERLAREFETGTR